MGRSQAVPRGAAVLERRIADLFAYARVEYLQQTPRVQRLDLTRLLSHLAEDTRPTASAKDITLTTQPPQGECAVEADEHLISRAIENLLDNAIRHTPSGGHVWLTWRRHGAGAIITVSDDGPGIDQTTSTTSRQAGQPGARPPTAEPASA